MKPVVVVGLGMGPDDFSPVVRRAVDQAQVLAGGQRHLALFPDHPGRRIPWPGSVSQWLDEVAKAATNSRVAMLASGDPNFYGIAARVVERFGPEQVRIIPNVTAVQAALARLKLPADKAAAVSLHGRDSAPLFAALLFNDVVAVFTDPKNTPARVAQSLIERGQTGWEMAVAENLGSDDERVNIFDIAEATGIEVSPLNLIVLTRHQPVPETAFGTPDDRFEHSAGLITKAEVRAVALAKLLLKPHHVLWDLGAGCGSVGIEAGSLLWRGRVLAVERDPERVKLIEINRARFGAANVEIALADLPRGMDDLPTPDRVFVGGGGKALGSIIVKAAARLTVPGIIVVSAVRLEAVDAARTALSGAGLETEVVQVQISRGSTLADGHYLKALNPVWLITGQKV